MRDILRPFLWSACLGAILFSTHAEPQWLTSLPAALEKARAEDRAVLVNFTGSDWCGWCIKLKKEVFDQAAFKQFADRNLVLVEIDFPRRKKLPAAQQQTNEQLAKQHGIRGFPTILVFDKQGRKLGETGYQPGGADNYVKHLKGIRGYGWKDGKSDAPQPPPPTTPATPPPAAPSTPAPPEAAPAPQNNSIVQTVPPVDPPVYSTLALRGITGGGRRLALINNQTFAAGEKASVKVDGKPVLVECKEIRTDSVLVLVEGEKEPRELRLQPRKP